MKFLITILCLISSVNNYAQKNHQIIDVDHLGYIYTVNGDELRKYDSNKILLSNFSNPLLGEISSLDVSNPLRLLLFYKEFNQILYLDQNLTPIGDPLDLYNYSDNETELCCNASPNGIWIYNKEDNQAFQISKQGEVLNKSNLLNNYVMDAHPSKMIVHQEKLHLLIPNKGIVILNKFGKFDQQIPLPQAIDFCLDNQKLNYLNGKQWFEYIPIEKSDNLIYEMANSAMFQSKVFSKQIYILNGDQISIKKLKY
ncbi:hypothetical protein L3073_17810 [Ancylomarina sp. DW003]|nr:hypothetical protein [Ancylomarina sp. DW003]MDE5424074.1 hypothetical protein [Ancylomarina sp. DW003]